MKKEMISERMFGLNDIEEIVRSYISELRRGTLILCVLSRLDEPKFGYSLVQELEEKGIPIDAGTLYPLLRRLEKQNLLSSIWELTDSRPRRYYFLSDTGKAVYSRLCAEWHSMVSSMNKMIS